MKKNFLKSTIIIFVFVCGIIFTGCKAFVPAQPNSNYKDSKRETPFEIKMLDDGETKNCDGFNTNYFLAFGHSPGEVAPLKVEAQFVPLLLAAPAVAALVGAALNYISASVSNEAASYQAKYGDTLTDDKFMTTNKSGIYQQRYFGMEITRKVDMSGTNTINAFRLVCGIDQSADGQLFIVKPLSFEIKKSKAKLVGNGFLSWALIYPHLALDPGSQINSMVDFNFVGYFRDKDQTLKTISMGAFSFKFNGYDLKDPKPLSYVTKNMPKQASGFVDSAPISFDSGSKPVSTKYAGNVSLTVGVTESDASNVKGNLNSIAQFISKETPSIVMVITNKF